jgi:hypothetical protein
MEEIGKIIKAVQEKMLKKREVFQLKEAKDYN